ncbi:sirohydrochlorin ferrochelatase [Motilibacter peucedani]|uniref:Sirohydrochlorin ferrochelatase n=1 Tax=Motilibacter peucedani TaxID=598650 RepID=A0A420XTT8_9ACTN|nr:CbiX/SirB N-terminal domain-containing protein [Motilibacter peucedani]RKS80248.1 sirohydrochlorin ferrochelatase [Motilibacter peucedani]
MSRHPVVVAAHGTADVAGQQTVEAVVERARLALPGREVVVGYLDVITPTVGDALAALDAPAVVVPLLLAPGYHVDVDLPTVAAAAGHPVTCSAPVGPDARILHAVLRRLREAGYRDGDPVVLGAAGSSSPRSAAATAQAVEWLAALTGGPVLAAYASASPPTPAEAVAALRREHGGRVALATYLLAPGFFADRMHDAGADLVSAPIGTADELLEVLVERVAAADERAPELAGR